MRKRIVGIAAVMLAVATLSACSNKPKTKDPKTASVQSSEVVLKKVQPSVVGTYCDDNDGAAILFRKDGTGRYVYRDSESGNTDDQFTWKKKNSTTFEVTMNDDNVTNPLAVKLGKNKLTLSGSGDWNTENFNRVIGKKLDLDEFLKEGESSSSTVSSSQNSSSEEKSSSVSSSTSQKSNIPGDEGLADVPSELQGTWYSGDHFGDDDNDSISTLTLGEHTVSFKGGEGSGTTILHKRAKDFDSTKYIQDKSYMKATKDWGICSMLNVEGQKMFNVMGYNQGAGDGAYYYLMQEEGQTVLVEAGGAGAWADAVYWKDEASAKKYANHKFSNIRYYPDSDDDDNTDDE